VRRGRRSALKMARIWSRRFKNTKIEILRKQYVKEIITESYIITAI
jgi:hypothetical protein